MLKAKKGRLLISEPSLSDDTFFKSVILLTHHNVDESIGLILNQPTNVNINEILNDIPANKLSSTAVILGDETLLLPLLNAIPKHIKDVNITMGLPLQKVPLASFFELLFTLQLNNTSELYYKHVLELFNHPSLQYVLEVSKLNVVSYINTGNIVSIKFDSLIAQSSAEESEIVKLLFSSSENNPEHFISRILKIIQYFAHM